MKKRLFFAVMMSMLMMLILAVPAFASEVEDNGSKNLANQISVNTEYTGNASSSSDIDFYKFTLTENQTIQVQVRFDGVALNKMIDLTHEDGTEIIDGAYVGSDAASPWKSNRYNLPPGTYYISLDGYNYNSVTDNYYLTIVQEAASSDGIRETEFNNSKNTADIINVNTAYVGNAANSSDIDFYKFTLTENQVIQLKFEHKGSSLNKMIDLTLGSDTEIIDGYYVGSDKASPWYSNRYNLPPGEYYLSVDGYNYNSVNEDYIFTVIQESPSTKGARETEFNGSLNTADEIQLNTPVVGNASTSSDSDYFTFTLSQASQITLNFTFDGVALNKMVHVYDSTGDDIWDDYLGSDLASPWTSSTMDLAAGKYYVSVDGYNYNSVNDDYVLTVSNGGAAVTPPVEPVEPVVPETPVTTGGMVSGFAAESMPFGANFSWQAVSGALGYRIYRSEVQGSEGISITDFYIENENRFVDVNVEGGKTYWYSIRPIMAEADPFNDMPETLGQATAQVQVVMPATIVGGDADSGTAPKQFILMQINNPMMTINGRVLEVDPGQGTSPIIKDSRTLVPIRAIVEGMGGYVGWNEANRQIDLSYANYNVQMWLGSKSLVANGQTMSMDVPPDVLNGRTMLPIRFAAENLGCDVEWINSTREIVIVYR